MLSGPFYYYQVKWQSMRSLTKYIIIKILPEGHPSSLWCCTVQNLWAAATWDLYRGKHIILEHDSKFFSSNTVYICVASEFLLFQHISLWFFANLQTENTTAKEPNFLKIINFTDILSQLQIDHRQLTFSVNGEKFNHICKGTLLHFSFSCLLWLLSFYNKQSNQILF